MTTRVCTSGSHRVCWICFEKSILLKMQRMLRKTKHPVGRPKDVRKHELVLDAARELFFQHGVAAVTLSAVAEAASVSRMTVYAYFGTKANLFEAVIARQAETLAVVLSATDHSAPEPATDREGLKAELELFGLSLLSFLRRPDVQAWNRLRQSEASTNPEIAAIFQKVGPGIVLRRLATRLRRADRSGALAVPRPQEAARHFIGMLTSLNLGGGSPLGKQHKSENAVRKHVQGCVQAFLRAYGKSRSA